MSATPFRHYCFFIADAASLAISRLFRFDAIIITRRHAIIDADAVCRCAICYAFIIFATPIFRHAAAAAADDATYAIAD